MKKYRERIYSNYVKARDESVVPMSLNDLAVRAPTMHRVIRDFFPKDKSAAILDLGCGNGTLVYFASLAGYSNIQGVDVSAQQVDLANKLGILNVRQGDFIETLKTIPPESLDALVAFDVIEHFTKDELIDLVDAVNSTLKPGGRWIIHAPSANSPFFGSIRYGDYTHEQAFTPASLQQLMKSSNYSKVEFAECTPLVHGLRSLLRAIVWKLFRFILLIANAAETGELNRNIVLTRNFYAIVYK